MERISTDVVVVGSGGAALTAALAARSMGAEVVLLEKSALIGGTTAMSGGLLWIPDNRHMRLEGRDDSFDEAFRYIRRLTGGRRADEDVRTVLGAGPGMVDFLE
jgi:3-oxosteroid 1-dehydrogenase